MKYFHVLRSAKRNGTANQHVPLLNMSFKQHKLTECREQVSAANAGHTSHMQPSVGMRASAFALPHDHG